MLVRRRKRNWRRLLRRRRGTRLLSYFSQKITRKLHGKLHGNYTEIKASGNYAKKKKTLEKVAEQERRNTTVLHGNYTEIYTETTQKLKPAEKYYITRNGLKRAERWCEEGKEIGESCSEVDEEHACFRKLHGKLHENYTEIKASGNYTTLHGMEVECWCED